jgi:cell division septation protein DedD
LVIAITLFFIRPADKPNKSQPPKTLTTYKIYQPSDKLQPKKTPYPEKEASDQEAGPVGFDKVPPQREVLQEMQTIPKIEAKITAADEINEFLRKWKAALQNTAGKGGDIETYMSFYSDDFISKGLDKNGWRYDKVEKNREKEWIKVELKAINISEPVVNNRAEVSFFEYYKSSNLLVISNKIMILKKEEAGWNIIGIKVVGASDSPLVSPEKNIDQTVAAPSKLRTYPYTIHISSHRDKQHANRLVTKLRKEGTLAFTSFVNIPSKGDWYRVFISYYGTLEEAQDAALKFKSQKAFYAKVVKKPYAIQVGLFNSDQELKKVESDLWAKGYTPYGIPNKRYKGGTRLFIGAFDSKKDADGQIRKLQNERFTLTVVER